MPNNDIRRPSRPQVELKEREKSDRYLDFARELENMEKEDVTDTNCNQCIRNKPQRIDKKTRRLRKQWTSRDHPDYSIIKIGQNTDKSP